MRCCRLKAMIAKAHTNDLSLGARLFESTLGARAGPSTHVSVKDTFSLIPGYMVQNLRHMTDCWILAGFETRGLEPPESVVKFARRLRPARTPEVGHPLHNRRAERRRRVCPQDRAVRSKHRIFMMIMVSYTNRRKARPRPRLGRQSGDRPLSLMCDAKSGHRTAHLPEERCLRFRSKGLRLWIEPTDC